MEIWVTLILGLIGGGGIASLIMAWQAAKKTKPEIGVLKSQENENIAEAAQVAANVLLQALNFKQVESKEYQERVKALETKQEESTKLINELVIHRDERTKQMEELKRQAEEAIDNNEALLSQVAALRAQIAKDTAETRELHQKYQELKEFTKSIIDALEAKGIKLPELNGKIPESIKGWRWEEKK
jgi:chromosome segregation ATPase